MPVKELHMKLLQKSSKMGQCEPASAAGAEDLSRRSLRLRAEREIDRNIPAESDYVIAEKNQ
jgi:hypothetical protein